MRIPWEYNGDLVGWYNQEIACLQGSEDMQQNM